MFSLDTEVRHYLTTFVYDLHSRVEVEVFLLYFVSLLEQVMKRIKNLEDIPVAVWRCLEGRAVDFLTTLFNTILESERMPEE